MIYTQHLFYKGFMNYRILCWVLPFIILFSSSSVFLQAVIPMIHLLQRTPWMWTILTGKNKLRIRITRQPFGICWKQLKRILKTQMSLIYSAIVIAIWKWTIKPLFIMKRHCLSTHVIKEPMNTLGNFTWNWNSLKKQKNISQSWTASVFLAARNLMNWKRPFRVTKKITEPKVYYPQKISGGVSHLPDNPFPSPSSSLNLPSRWT